MGELRRHKDSPSHLMYVRYKKCNRVWKGICEKKIYEECDEETERSERLRKVKITFFNIVNCYVREQHWYISGSVDLKTKRNKSETCSHVQNVKGYT